MENIDIERQVAKYLLDIKAVELQPEKPFTWASGWKSPIYTDNRKTLSYPEARNFLKQCFADIIRREYPGVELIAGVATGAIAVGALVADLLGLPFVYVRSASKGHGLENQVEGVCHAGQKVVVIEDLVSTGMSSLKAVSALREKGCEIMSMIAIFTYGFPVAEQAFKDANCTLRTLSNYNALIALAKETGYVKEQQIDALLAWRKSPDTWGV
ncbi:MAG: orotate phosphoribosyltransferase [Bacteroidales bacterium]|jgi:orotate phosphoribosyltransferase|nr:orotate phosphoribosyltransferase [Bacteroidales bacterium]MBQ2098125.1 orotate phosphoribosyltransferase [Bacteroidales bacterium]MBQ5513475.1 orotate phosphoribosyltransferase [Bacteroidales bacterium]MBR2104705.1 orotate phosphoribosyltransferase [Bacteroidales bacterium]MBR4272603.1 orotate phosphoribosyltransferase [Bacteroidales bacterium]